MIKIEERIYYFQYRNYVLEKYIKIIQGCDFYVYPLREKWKKARRMHSSEILPILKFYVDLGFNLSNKRPDLYKAMESEIVKRGFVQLV